MWKACKEWLPVRANLVRRNLNVERWCPFCFNKVEIVIHGLWKCPLLKRIRESFVNFRSLAVSKGMHFLDFIISCKINGLATIFNPGSFNSVDIVSWAATYLEKFRCANFDVANVPDGRDVVTPA
ncbi:hypothetical protein LWI28_016342 [Acer negundo]|uniref:Reverse transcriptase zinc-binding domain-containing protein n=1 Tax=Acer negundo TaxID=4023 RepID=A0AAD5JLY4_ACENE|nr:hypothetical protein LWI28_016342 [Acer negundo]